MKRLASLTAIVLLGIAVFVLARRPGHGFLATKKPVADAPTSGLVTGRPAPTSQAGTFPHFQPREVSLTTGNVLVNPGFEEGATGWTWLEWSSGWGPFEIGTAHTFAGKRAAHLEAHGLPTDPATRVFGVVQEIRSAVFPARISGQYLVERWKPGATRKAYVQVVLIAMRASGRQPTMQLRYVLDGMEEQPHHMTNARYIVVHPRRQPPIGKWIDFSLDLHEDYRRLWGEVPPNGTGYRVLFEARYDEKAPGETVALDVWYDELFVGTP